MSNKTLIDELNRKIKTISDISNEMIGLMQLLEKGSTGDHTQNQERIKNLENTVKMLSTLLEVAMIEFQSIAVPKKEPAIEKEQNEMSNLDGRIFKIMDYYVQLRKRLTGIQLDDENFKTFLKVKEEIGFK